MSGLTRTASSHSGRQLFNLKMGIDDLIIIYMSVYEYNISIESVAIFIDNHLESNCSPVSLSSLTSV